MGTLSEALQVTVASSSDASSMRTLKLDRMAYGPNGLTLTPKGPSGLIFVPATLQVARGQNESNSFSCVAASNMQHTDSASVGVTIAGFNAPLSGSLNLMGTLSVM